MKLNRVWLLAVLILSATRAIAAEGENVVSISGKRAAEDLTYRVAFDPKNNVVRDILGPALAVVGAVAPAGFSMSVGGGDRPNFIIEVTDSKTINKDIEAHRAQGAILSSTADAYTLVLAEHPKGPFIVRLLWDKLTTEARNGQVFERPDAFIRVVAAVGHEIYGNVRTFHSRENVLLDPSHRYSNKFQLLDQTSFELAAFQAGLDTLHKVLELGQQKGFSDKMLSDIRAAIIRETDALTGWLKEDSRLRAEAAKLHAPLERAGAASVTSLTAKRCEMLFRPAQ